MTGSVRTAIYAYDGWDTAKPGATGTENFDVRFETSNYPEYQLRLNGPGVDEVLARQTGGGVTTWYATDHQGSVRVVLNDSGTSNGTINYTAFGERTATGTGAAADLGYASKYWDFTLGLQYNLARWYDPVSGKWLSEDPMSFDAGDANLYRYVANNPTTHRDPSGMQLIIPPSDVNWWKKLGDKVTLETAAGGKIQVSAPWDMHDTIAESLRKSGVDGEAIRVIMIGIYDAPKIYFDLVSDRAIQIDQEMKSLNEKLLVSDIVKVVKVTQHPGLIPVEHVHALIRAGKAIPENLNLIQSFKRPSTNPDCKDEEGEYSVGLVSVREVALDGMIHTVILEPVNKTEQRLTPYAGGLHPYSRPPQLPVIVGTLGYRVVEYRHAYSAYPETDPTIIKQINADVLNRESGLFAIDLHKRRIANQRNFERDMKFYSNLEMVLTAAVHILPGGGALFNYLHGGNETDLAFSIAGDVALTLTGLGAVTKGMKLYKLSRTLIATSGIIEGGIAVEKLVKAVHAFTGGDSTQGTMYLTESFMRLLGVTIAVRTIPRSAKPIPNAQKTGIPPKPDPLSERMRIENQFKEAQVREEFLNKGQLVKGTASLPEDARKALTEIEKGAARPNVRKSQKFDNDGREASSVLPREVSGKPIQYTEHTVNPRPPHGSLDGKRIVVGSDGTVWYTENHFRSFTRVK